MEIIDTVQINIKGHNTRSSMELSQACTSEARETCPFSPVFLHLVDSFDPIQKAKQYRESKDRNVKACADGLCS